MAHASLRSILTSIRVLVAPRRQPEPRAADRAPVAPDTQQARYRTALAALPEETRAIFLQHRADGLDIATIAARTGHSTAEVERHIATALLAILDELDSDRR